MCYLCFSTATVAIAPSRTSKSSLTIVMASLRYRESLLSLPNTDEQWRLKKCSVNCCNHHRRTLMKKCSSEGTIGEAPLSLYTRLERRYLLRAQYLCIPWEPLPTRTKVVKLDLWHNMRFSVEHNLGEREVVTR